MFATTDLTKKRDACQETPLHLLSVLYRVNLRPCSAPRIPSSTSAGYQ